LGSFLLLAAVGIAGVVVNGEPVLEQIPYVIAFTMFGVVGALLLSRDRGNRIGALFLYGAFTTALAFATAELMTSLVDSGTTDGAFVVTLAVINNIGWLVGILPVLFFVTLLFPDGRLPSPRWRWFALLLVATLALMTAGELLGSEELTGSVEEVAIANPLFVPALGGLDTGAFGLVLIALLAGSVGSLVIRFRRSRDVERQQIRWVTFAGVLLFVGLIASEALFAAGVESALVDVVFAAPGFLALPISVGIAVLKYRLYDLDVVVRKTVVFGLLAALATLVYLALVVGVGALVGRGSSFLTMVAAVVVAVTFQPARQRITHLANRLVYGDRATPYEVLSDFADRVGGAYAADDVMPRMARVLAEGTGADRATVWLKVGDQLRPAAVWPSEADRPAPVRLANGTLPEDLPDADTAFAVRHHDELLGALAVRKPPSDPVSPAEEKLVADLAAQAGLVLRNERLTEELRARLEDLQAAQRRIVEAQDEERRRLERNIHDGAQQQLVALAVKARLARSLAEREPARASQMLEEVESDSQDALENLRDLARGIYPPLLADKGLVAALEAQSRKSPLPVHVHADGVARYPQAVEAAAYFCCLEALQNVAKYAGASQIEVRLAFDDDVLTFEVIDDGAGFDPALRASGTGLQGMADRVAALDGALTVRSAPGQGTTVAGRIPVLSIGAR
jgi:signal transduction histidine kinase